MHIFAPRVQVLITTLWAGSLWTIGYIVAPTLFASLSDRILAGSIAGSLFRVEAWLSVFCAVALLLLHYVDRKTVSSKARIFLTLVSAMLACTLIGYFVLHPFMSALRDAAGPNGVMLSAARMQFGLLHGAASIFYLIESVLAVILVFKTHAR